MPGWYIHMDVARKALQSLDTTSAASLFGAGGPSTSEIDDILRPENRAYAALGALGPDLFFLLPDFKPPEGQHLWGVANWVKEKYTKWDEEFLLPYEFYILPDALNASDIKNALTGGLSKQISDIFSKAFDLILEMALSLIFRQYDFFGLLGSGVPQGYDEKTFFWSDMFHYRKTYEFAHHLWTQADQSESENKDRFKAFALGWMTHLATDVTGHAFVNDKCGGPYRLHWQRHHLIENHMDAKVYDAEHGSLPIYQMLSCAALHLWIAFDEDNDFASLKDFFATQPGPDYKTSDDAEGILSRKAAWDADPKMDPKFASFLADAIRSFYGRIRTSEVTDQLAAHPTIIADIKPASEGFPDADAIATTYWWLFQYLKHVSTDFFKFRKPELKVWNFAPFPSPPGTGSKDPPPESDDDPWEDLLEILGWLWYIGEVIEWGVANLFDTVTGPLSYPIRDYLYDHVELPLYNAWMAVHLYLARSGFVMPLQSEIEPGLMTLGQGDSVDLTNLLVALINDLSGGLLSEIGVNPPIPTKTQEKSGSDRDQDIYPKNVVLDPPDFTEQEINTALQTNLKIDRTCGAGETPSEFLRPWQWPDVDNQRDPVPSEFPVGRASPYKAKENALRLIDTDVGDPQARSDFQDAGSEHETLGVIQRHLPAGRTLGSPIDYAGYVIATLTRDDPGRIANFNLDADRGYGYLCWDWLRDENITATPAAYRGHTYHAPIAPDLGWCDRDLDPGAPPPGDPTRPAAAVPPSDVYIRYIDWEARFR